MTYRIRRTAAILTASALAALLSTASLAADKTALVGGRLIDGFGHRPLADSVYQPGHRQARHNAHIEYHDVVGLQEAIEPGKQIGARGDVIGAAPLGIAVETATGRPPDIIPPG